MKKEKWEEEFDKIAREMIKDKEILPQFLLFAAKKKAYVKIVNEISISGNLK